MARARPWFRLPASREVPGLGADTSSLSWLGRPSDEALSAEAAAAGLEPGDGDDVVTLTDGALATAEALRRFVAASDGVAGDVVGALEGPAASWSDEPAFGDPARLVRLRGGGPATPERLEAASRVSVEVPSQPFDVPLLDRPGGRTEVLHASPAVLVARDTWAGVLWANLLALGPALVGALPGPAAVAPARVLWAALQAVSTDPVDIGLRLVRKGRDVSIHPSAVVEASWLLDGAVVDAGAIVRHSIVGPGAVVEPQALVLGGVLGPRARIQRRGFVTYGVVEADGVVGGTLQLGLVGPRAQVKVGAILLDQALGGPARVQVGDRLVDAPLGLLGAGLGADAMVGAGVHVAAGRLVRAGVHVVGGQDAILVRPDAAGPGRYRVSGGGLEPC